MFYERELKIYRRNVQNMSRSSLHKLNHIASLFKHLGLRNQLESSEIHFDSILIQKRDLTFDLCKHSSTPSGHVHANSVRINEVS